MGCSFGMPRKLMLGKRPLAKISLSILILYDFPALPSLKPSMNKQCQRGVQWEKKNIPVKEAYKSGVINSAHTDSRQDTTTPVLFPFCNLGCLPFNRKFRKFQS